MLLKEPGSNFGPHPEGVFKATCIDVHDLGMKDTQFGPKQKLLIRFFAGEREEDGTPLYVGQTFTASLHKRSRLRQFLNSWLGTVPAQLDPESLVGKAVTIRVRQEDVNGRTFVNIISIMPLDDPADAPTLPEYVRMADRSGGDEWSKYAV